MRLEPKLTVYLITSLLAGFLIAWVDSRPGWDDTGLTAGTIVLTAALFGYLRPDKPWLWGLTVGSWIPLHALILNGNFMMLLVTLFGIAGAYLGAAIKNNKPAPK